MIKIASFWKRGTAFVIDSIVISIIIWGLFLVNPFVVPLFSVIYSIFAMFFSLFYFIVLEWVYGQTLVKRLFNLNVVNKKGRKITWTDSVVRNVLRLVDILPFLYIVGIISILVTEKRQRLGDLAANTLVVENLKKRLRWKADLLFIL